MEKIDAIKALEIYKRAGQQVHGVRVLLSSVLWVLGLHGVTLAMLQAERLSAFYDYCKRLELARTFQFPTLRQVC
jgi:hypothetical protein